MLFASLIFLFVFFHIVLLIYYLLYPNSISAQNIYFLKSYGKCFLGSEGVRAGEYYVGLDDFNIFITSFPMNFSYKYYTE